MFKDFDDYRSYLDAHKYAFPENIYSFAAAEERHNLTSPHSLHDSWLSSISIREHRNCGGDTGAWTSLEISLLGQMHDRNINLSYHNVHAYEITGAQNPYNWADTYHGDVNAHAITLGEQGTFIHEIYFASGSKIKVFFENFQCTEVACK